MPHCKEVSWYVHELCHWVLFAEVAATKQGAGKEGVGGQCLPSIHHHHLQRTAAHTAQGATQSAINTQSANPACSIMHTSVHQQLQSMLPLPQQHASDTRPYHLAQQQQQQQQQPVTKLAIALQNKRRRADMQAPNGYTKPGSVQVRRLGVFYCASFTKKPGLPAQSELTTFG